MPFWSVVRSLPQKERFAASQLELRGYEIFLPMVSTKRSSAPLFNSYFFVRIVEQWRTINTCFGVLALVRVGDCPSKMPDAEIEALKAMTDGHGYIRLPEAPATPAGRKIAVGCKVKITAGPFGGMAGLYAGQSTRERELILLNLLGRQTPVTIAANLVVTLNESTR
jgi:transcriptional antiterminator RfaH